MWFATFLARNAKINKPSVPSEDDTFLALRRIPFEEVSRRLLEFDYDIINERVYDEFRIADLNKQEKKKHKWFWLLDLLHIDYQIVIWRTTHPLKDIDLKQFEGTGWTVEDFVEEVRTRVAKDLEQRETEKKLKFKKMLMWTLLVANIMPWVTIFFGPFPWAFVIGLPLAIGVTTGWILSQVL